MARKKKEAIDKEVLEVQDVLPITEGEVNPPEPPVDPDPETPPVDPTPTNPVRLTVAFHRVDAILAGLSQGQTLTEALAVDPELSALFATHNDLIIRETRDSRYIRFKDGVEAKFTANPDGIWTQPVSYSN